MNRITGRIFRDAVISGSNQISHLKKSVDELNVFPVPDGDTGTNMSMTISSAAREFDKRGDEELTIAEASKATAGALLRGARGNSGVILSLLFRGISKSLADKEDADGADLANALTKGVKSAYKAVMKPTEGTILTVAREAAEKGMQLAETEQDPAAVWEGICDEADASLARTPELLPVLKKAGVVDAGGKGFCLIARGMLEVFRGNPILTFEDACDGAEKAEAAQTEDAPRFAYQVKLVINHSNKDRDPLSMRAYFESIGDAVKISDETETIRVSLNTDVPGKILTEALKYGELAEVEIENLHLKHQAEERQEAAEEKAAAESIYVPVDENVPIGFVSVAAGSGVQSLFTDLGCGRIVSGGQTMNPSTEDILEAVQSVGAKCVFVLPNNKNIIMAAEQAIRLADRQVIVLHTKTIPQGISAMLAFDPDADAEANQIAMTEAYERVQSGAITFAARDAEFDGFSIKEGELMAMLNGKIDFIDHDLSHAVIKLARQMVKKDHSFFTLIVGEDVDDVTAARLESELTDKLSGMEITTVRGDQPVYYVMMASE